MGAKQHGGPAWALLQVASECGVPNIVAGMTPRLMIVQQCRHAAFAGFDTLFQVPRRIEVGAGFSAFGMAVGKVVLPGVQAGSLQVWVAFQVPGLVEQGWYYRFGRLR